MRTTTYTDSEGNTVSETHDRNGRLVHRSVASSDGSVTNVASGSVGIQARTVSGRTVRR